MTYDEEQKMLREFAELKERVAQLEKLVKEIRLNTQPINAVASINMDALVLRHRR